jgi:hypothetical protein
MDVAFLILYKLFDGKDPFFLLEVNREADDLLPFNFREYMTSAQRTKVHNLEIDETQDMEGGHFQVRCFGQILKSKCYKKIQVQHLKYSPMLFPWPKILYVIILKFAF